MLKTKLKFHIKLVIAVILTLGLSISLQSILAQWQAPTAGPPSGNIKTPINTGVAYQEKLGSFSIGGDFGVSQDMTVDGYMAINAATSSSRLRLLDDVGGPDIYIQGNGVNPELALGDNSNYWSIYSDETDTDELRFWRGGNRMALTDTGTLKIKEICDENGANCVDVSAGMGGGVGGAGGVPKNAVVAFNSLTCPTDWQVADGTNGTPDLRGRFIRGLDSGGSTNDPDSPRTLRSFQIDQFKSHTHQFKAVEDGSGFASIATLDSSAFKNGNRDVRRYNTTSAGGSETRPVNIALTYCVKMTDPVASGGTFREILSNPVLMASGDNAAVPLTTLNVNNYVSVPSWATSVILRGWSNVGHNKSVRMYINGQTAPFVDTNSGNGDMSDTNSETFIMSGTSITYSVTMSSQWSHYKLWVVGFEGPSSGGGGGASIDTASCYTKEVSTSNYVVECNPGDVMVGIRHYWSYGDDASGSGLENIKCCPFN